MTTPSRADVLARIDSGSVPAWLSQFVGADAAADRFSRWGRSTVVDANTNEPVISEALFDELHALAGVAAHWPIGNAGLLHVYGYLLSTAETPYGLKRDRWLGGGVARAVGLPDDAFTPWFTTPSARDSTPLERVLTVAEPFIVDPADGDLTVLWIDETGEGDTVARTVVVSDDDSGSSALVYAVGPTDAPLLVTLFPLATIDDQWFERLVAGEPQLRYNAVDARNVASAPLLDREVTMRND